MRCIEMVKHKKAVEYYLRLTLTWDVLKWSYKETKFKNNRD